MCEHGEEPESFAGLVHALRFCGLLNESVYAHERATALDPTIVTSVPHTHFLRCEYEATLDSYCGTRYYLDAAAWAALGDAARASTLLQERLAGSLSPQMSGLMGSLAAVLDGRRDAAMAMMMNLEVAREPEVVFYLSRHFALLNAADESVRLLQRARREGFTCSYALAHDRAFTSVRGHQGFQRELRESEAAEQETRRALERAGANHVLGRSLSPQTSRVAASAKSPRA